MSSIRLPDSISKGAHASPSEGMCVMETVAYIAGEPHSDHPECACPVITAFAIRVNDYLPSDHDRMRLLAPLVWKIAGTRGSQALTLRRAARCQDWAVHEIAPLALGEKPMWHATQIPDLGTTERAAFAASNAAAIASLVAAKVGGIWESAAALLAELCEMQEAEVSR